MAGSDFFAWADSFDLYYDLVDCTFLPCTSRNTEGRGDDIRNAGLLAAFVLAGIASYRFAIRCPGQKKPSRRPAPKLEVPTPDPQQDYKQQALELLPLLSERIDAIKSPSWKVRLKAFLAELLATHNPEGARQLFQESLQSLHAVPVRRPQDVQMSIQILNQHRDGVAAAPTPSQLSAEGMTSWELNSLSSELLARAAMADPTYAEALAENLAYTLTESDDAQRLARRKARVVGPVGLSLAKDQPELAAQWVEKNLGTGVSIWTYLTLETLRQQNPQLADATFNKALSHFESDPSGSVRWVLHWALLVPEYSAGTVRGC